MTDLAVSVGDFSARLQTLGYRLMRVVDAQGTTLVEYIEPPMCPVVAGSFLMGTAQKSHASYRDETPQHSVTLAAFQIGKYPVTIGEYDCAVSAGAVERPQEYESERMWEGELSYPDWPVSGLDWFRATQYARWMREVTGQAWSLPSEAQWEKAARGTHGRLFPWGDERDPALGTTNDGTSNILTPVGQFPAESASPYGVFDLVGGVFEWTSSIPTHYPYNPYSRRKDQDSREEPRVMRGGHYGGYSSYVHAAYRFSDRPYASNGYYGFRLVLGQDYGEM